MGAKSLEDLKIWQKGRAVCKYIHPIIWSDRFKYDFNLRSQIWSTANSVPANIAEGFERMGNKEFINFLSYAKASAAELKSYGIIAYDNGYLNDEEYRYIYDECNSLRHMIGAFMEFLIISDQKGSKVRTNVHVRDFEGVYLPNESDLSNKDQDDLILDIDLLMMFRTQLDNYIEPQTESGSILRTSNSEL